MHHLIFLIYIFFSVSNSHDYVKADITIDHPVLRIPAENANVGAGYMEIINNSADEIKLLDIEASIAKKQEIHEVVLEDKIYKMRPVKYGLLIKSNEKLIFKNKSYHFMFFNLLQNYRNNDMIEAKLIFDNDLKIPIKFKVILGNKDKDHNH